MNNETYNDFLSISLDMPPTKLKAKILLLQWKDVAAQYENIGYTTKHIYYRSLQKIPYDLVSEAGKELLENLSSPQIEYALINLKD